MNRLQPQDMLACFNLTRIAVHGFVQNVEDATGALLFQCSVALVPVQWPLVARFRRRRHPGINQFRICVGSHVRTAVKGRREQSNYRGSR